MFLKQVEFVIKMIISKTLTEELFMSAKYASTANHVKRLSLTLF